MGYFLSLIPAHVNLNPECTLSELVLPKKFWDLDIFRLWLSGEIIQRIVSVPPPHPFLGQDTVIWLSSTSGGFSIRGVC